MNDEYRYKTTRDLMAMRVRLHGTVSPTNEQRLALEAVERELERRRRWQVALSLATP